MNTSLALQPIVDADLAPLLLMNWDPFIIELTVILSRRPLFIEENPLG
jgi:hypothetical protein